MRCLAVVLVWLSACYHPTVASDVPCSSAGTCPTGQQCDLGHAPPVCVTSLGDGGPRDTAPADTPVIDAPIDAPAIDAPVVPIAFVQSATTKPTTAVTTLAFTANVAAHDAIVLCLNYPVASNATVASVTDTLGNTYAPVVGPIDGSARHYVVAAYDTSAGADTLTVTLSAAPSGGSDLLIMEYSGLALTSAFDASASATGTGTAMDSGGATTTFPHELILGYAEGPSATPGAGFTQRAIQTGNITEDRVVTSTGTYDATATTTTGAWTMIVATFKGQ